jgi:hypothetical protein
MNNEIRLELERAEMETFKGGGGGYHWRRGTIIQYGLLPLWHTSTPQGREEVLSIV